MEQTTDLPAQLCVDHAPISVGNDESSFAQTLGRPLHTACIADSSGRSALRASESRSDTVSSPKYRLGYPDASLSLPARAGADGSGPDGRHDNADLGGFAGTDGRPPESIPDEPPEHKPGSNAGHGHSASTARYADGIEHSRRVGSPVASSPPIRRRPRLSAILQAQLMLRFGAEPGAFSTSLSRALAVSGRPALSEQSPHCKALHRLTHLFRPQTRRRDHAPGPPFRRDDAALPEEGLAFPRSRSPQLTPSRKLRSQPTGCAFSQPSTA